MATIPDRLIADIRNFLDINNGVTDKETAKHNSFVYAIDLTVEYDIEPDRITETGYVVYDRIHTKQEDGE